jgi:NitT/TauT family transport system substrate-binding protein
MPIRSTLALALFLAVGAAGHAQAQTAVTLSLDTREFGRHAAWYVALDKGYYKKEGLDVTIKPSQGPAQAIQSVESKSAQFAFSDVANLVAAYAKGGATAKMVAVIYQKAPYAIFTLESGANVLRPDQLEDLEIAASVGSPTQKLIDAFIKSKGLKAETVKYTDADPDARFGMLAEKKIPGIESVAMSLPAVVKAVGGKEARMLLLANSGLSVYANGIVVRDDYLKSDAAKVKGFVKASLQGWKDTIANPKAAAEIVSKHVKGLDPETVFQEIVIANSMVATPDTRAKGLGTIDAKIMADSVAFIDGAVGGKVVAKDIYDTSALPAPPIK